MICYQRVEEKVSSKNLCECYPACDELTYNVDRLQMDHITYVYRMNCIRTCQLRNINVLGKLIARIYVEMRA